MNEEIENLKNNFIKEQENYLVDQLNDLIKNGILLIESSQLVVTIDDNNNLKMSKAIRLKCRDQEIIEDQKRKIKNLEKVLAWYADPKNYELQITSPASEDKGHLAREALD